MTFDPLLGPLGPLLGVWEGGAGTDVAPATTTGHRHEKATSKYRERMVFEAAGRGGPQRLCRCGAKAAGRSL